MGGFVKSYDYLDADVQAQLGLKRDGLYLYRSLLPVSLPGIAFLGSEVSTFNNVLTHGLQALWLSKLFTGAMALPPPREMQKAVEAFVPYNARDYRALFGLPDRTAW